MQKQSLQDRMKSYESVFDHKLPNRTNVVIRIDGKAFHTYTKQMNFLKPFDSTFVDAMDVTCGYLCENIQGVKAGYVQSDEISLILTSYDNNDTQAWVGNRINKIVSLAASMATAKFNEFINDRFPHHTPLALFDARAFILPSQSEVNNYLIWRQRDCIRNHIQSIGQAFYTHQELMHKNMKEVEQLPKVQEYLNDEHQICDRNGRFLIYKDVRWVLTTPPNFQEEPFCVEEHLKIKE